jgi:hypothetical protein
MVYSIKEHVREMRTKGYSDDMIEDQLKKSGIDELTIKRAMYVQYESFKRDSLNYIMFSSVAIIIVVFIILVLTVDFSNIGAKNITENSTTEVVNIANPETVEQTQPIIEEINQQAQEKQPESWEISSVGLYNLSYADKDIFCRDIISLAEIKKICNYDGRLKQYYYTLPDKDGMNSTQFTYANITEYKTLMNSREWECFKIIVTAEEDWLQSRMLDLSIEHIKAYKGQYYNDTKQHYVIYPIENSLFTEYYGIGESAFTSELSILELFFYRDVYFETIRSWYTDTTNPNERICNNEETIELAKLVDKRILES